MNKMPVLLSGALLLVGATACAPRISMDYSPQNAQTLQGHVDVKEFKYFPPEGVAQDEIQEAAVGQVHITEPIGKFVADAVRQELRAAGVQLRGSCTLKGEVNKFAMNSLGFSVDYMTDIRYILTAKSGNVLYDKSHNVKFNASKFTSSDLIMNSINKMVSDNISKLLKDPAFVRNFRNKCNKANV